jgi:hypothetical protein
MFSGHVPEVYGHLDPFPVLEDFLNGHIQVPHRWPCLAVTKVNNELGVAVNDDPRLAPY